MAPFANVVASRESLAPYPTETAIMVVTQLYTDGHHVMHLRFATEEDRTFWAFRQGIASSPIAPWTNYTLPNAMVTMTTVDDVCYLLFDYRLSRKLRHNAIAAAI